MSVLVRRLNLNPPLRHRQLRRELVLVVTSTRVALSMIHGLPALLRRTVLKAQFWPGCGSVMARSVRAWPVKSMANPRLNAQ